MTKPVFTKYVYDTVLQYNLEIDGGINTVPYKRVLTADGKINSVQGFSAMIYASKASVLKEVALEFSRLNVPNMLYTSVLMVFSWYPADLDETLG